MQVQYGVLRGHGANSALLVQWRLCLFPAHVLYFRIYACLLDIFQPVVVAASAIVVVAVDVVVVVVVVHLDEDKISNTRKTLFYCDKARASLTLDTVLQTIIPCSARDRDSPNSYKHNVSMPKLSNTPHRVPGLHLQRRSRSWEPRRKLLNAVIIVAVVVAAVLLFSTLQVWCLSILSWCASQPSPPPPPPPASRQISVPRGHQRESRAMEVPRGHQRVSRPIAIPRGHQREGPAQLRSPELSRELPAR
jgi:hypothetical protein